MTHNQNQDKKERFKIPNQYDTVRTNQIKTNKTSEQYVPEHWKTVNITMICGRLEETTQ